MKCCKCGNHYSYNMHVLTFELEDGSKQTRVLCSSCMGAILWEAVADLGESEDEEDEEEAR